RQRGQVRAPVEHGHRRAGLDGEDDGRRARRLVEPRREMGRGGNLRPQGPRLGAGARPVRGRYRWWIGALLLFSTVINYLDRQTFSVLGPHLKEEFHWTNESFALVLISFRLAYTVGQPVMGRFLDRLGPRDGLTLGVLGYSLAAMLTSFASGLRSFCAFRFLRCAGEAANW